MQLIFSIYSLCYFIYQKETNSVLSEGQDIKRRNSSELIHGSSIILGRGVSISL